MLPGLALMKHLVKHPSETFFLRIVDLLDKLLHLASLIHVDAYVAAPDELAIDVQLCEGVRRCLDEEVFG